MKKTSKKQKLPSLWHGVGILLKNDIVCYYGYFQFCFAGLVFDNHFILGQVSPEQNFGIWPNSPCQPAFVIIQIVVSKQWGVV